MNGKEQKIVRRVQGYCARILADRIDWDERDAQIVAGMFNEADDPYGLFRYVDEKTGSSDVGYRTRDGREWFPILRQMRNSKPGLLDHLAPPAYR